MNPDGSDVQQIYSWGGGLASPSWSPDGRSIAVSVWGGLGTGIHLLNDNDTFWVESDTKLTSGQDGHPTWSPDGQKIAFDRWDPSLNDLSREIYEVNVDGTGLTRMDKGADPSWSPDGKRIAFDDQGAVWVIGAMPGRFQVSFGVMPDWSPDGKKIVVSNFRDGQIYVVNADGKGSETQLTTIGHNEFPSWSPDGKMIIFTSDREGELPPDLVKDPASQQRSTWNIYVMNADGSDQHSLTSRSYRCCAGFFPTWQSVAIPAATASVTTTSPSSGTSITTTSSGTLTGPIVINPIVVAVIFIAVIIAVVFALILAVRNARPSSRICKRCGAVNPKYAKTYCVQCGEPLRNSTPLG
jgi:TolB protein